MNAKISAFVICAEAIIYLLLHNLNECTFLPNYTRVTPNSIKAIYHLGVK